MPQTYPRLRRLLESAISLDRADFGTLQVFDEQTRTLKIVAQVGFSEEFLDHFRSVRPFDGSACGRAAGLGGAVVVADVARDPAFLPHHAVMKAAGVGSVKSQPIKDEDGLIGVISTHCRRVRKDWDLDALSPLLPKLAAALARRKEPA